MMTISKIKEMLDTDGKDTTEFDVMIEAFEDADTYECVEYYQNQLYGFICGLAALKYITPDDVNDAMNNLEIGTL